MRFVNVKKWEVNPAIQWHTFAFYKMFKGSNKSENSIARIVAMCAESDIVK